MNPIVVFNTFSAAEAQMVRSRLEAAGFHPEVSHELSSLSMEGYSLATGGISVMVPSTEAEDARALVLSKDSSGSEEVIAEDGTERPVLPPDESEETQNPGQ
jgi:hypothetical protein